MWLMSTTARFKEIFIWEFSVEYASSKSWQCEKSGTVRRLSHVCNPVQAITCILYVRYPCTAGRSVRLAAACGTAACFKGFSGLFHRSKKESVHGSVSSQHWKCAQSWMDRDYTHGLHTMQTSALNTFLSFPLFGFNRFKGGISWITVLWRKGFSISTLTKAKLLFYSARRPRCSHHLPHQTGFVNSLWSEYNVKWVLRIYPSYTALVGSRYVFDQKSMQCQRY